MELLDLEHGHSIVLRIDRYEQGVTTIHPKTITPRDVRIHMQQNGLSEPPAAGSPIYKQIPVLRVFGTRLDKPSQARYWDISSLRLQADLMPRLVANEGFGLTVTITALGEKPTKQFSVEQG